jgi:hypothetical protein
LPLPFTAFKGKETRTAKIVSDNKTLEKVKIVNGHDTCWTPVV